MHVYVRVYGYQTIASEVREHTCIYKKYVIFHRFQPEDSHVDRKGNVQVPPQLITDNKHKLHQII
jgi:hypothetical protein